MSDLGIDQKIFIALGGITMIGAFAIGAYLFIIIQQDERKLFLSVPRIKSNLYGTREYVRRLHLGMLMAAVVFVLTGLLLGYTEFAAGTKLALACTAVVGSVLHLVFDPSKWSLAIRPKRRNLADSRFLPQPSISAAM